jgi:hypothetical protein
MLVTKIVITHVAKSKCKLAIFTKVEWTKAPTFSKGLVERQALDDLGLDAMDLADVISDQVRKLGPQSRTKKAIQIFGYVGQQTSVSLFSATDSSHPRRPTIKQRTLTSMVYETTSSFAESVASSLMMWAFAAMKAIWNITSANSIILSILLLSVLTNLFFTGKDTSVWWTERNAAKFMSSIGVGPNLMMSKAVYLKDLDDVMGLQTEVLGQPDGRCYSTFTDIANFTDMDTAYQHAGTSFSESATRSTARRLRRTRQHLGSYRHDLLVAMRVVNNVEREMLRAEWENWLLDETTRCKQVQMMLRDGRMDISPTKRVKETEPQLVFEAKEKDRLGKMEKLREWQRDYCGSCLREQELLFESRRNPAVR